MPRYPPLVNSCADLVCDDSQTADMLNETFINQNFPGSIGISFWAQQHEKYLHFYRNICRRSEESNSLFTKHKLNVAVWRTNCMGRLQSCRKTIAEDTKSIPPLKKRFEYHTLTLFFKMKHQMVPQYLSSLVLAPTSESSRRYSFRKLSYPVPLVSKTSLNSVLSYSAISYQRHFKK